MKKITLKHEGSEYALLQREFDEFHGLTVATTTMNEEENIVEFLNHIKPLASRIVVIDGGSIDDTAELALPLVNYLGVIKFEGNFANQKNNAIRLCYTDWILWMDPDERLSDKLYKMIPSLIEQNEYDCYSFPRREIRDGKEDKKIYPDYQERLFRAYCRYVRPIHHELVGWKKKKEMPINEDLDIMHIKRQKRHLTRNTSYEHFERHYIHEMGMPGFQTKEEFINEYPHLFLDENGIPLSKKVLDDNGNEISIKDFKK